VLFVVCLSSDGTEAVAFQPSPVITVQPTVIAQSDLTGTQQSIRAKISEADDSYRVRFMTPVRMKVTATTEAAPMIDVVKSRLTTFVPLTSYVLRASRAT